MSQFKDKLNRMWDIVITGQSFKDVKEELDMSLQKCIRDDFFVLIIDEYEFLFDILWALLRHDAEQSKIDKRSFYSGLSGDCIVKARNALADAVIEFAPTEQKENYQKVWDKVQKMAEELQSQASKEIDKIDVGQEIEQAKEPEENKEVLETEV